MKTVFGLILLCGAATLLFAADVTGVWTGRITVRVPDRDDMPRMKFQGKRDGGDLKLIISGKNPSDGQERRLGDGLLKRVK